MKFEEKVMTDRNSWVLTVPRYYIAAQHHFFCECGEKFVRHTLMKNYNVDNVSCLACNNDYFKDAEHFLHNKSTRIWKHFSWTQEKYEDDELCRIDLLCFIPIYSEKEKSVQLVKHILASGTLTKDGTSLVIDVSKQKMIFQYSLYTEEKIQAFRTLLQVDIKEKLISFILEGSNTQIGWLNGNDFKKLSVEDKLKCLKFFVKNPYLKEFIFFSWENDFFDIIEQRQYSPLSLLNLISNNIATKNIKKALYESYESAMHLENYYNPYSDYIFSRAITNIDFLHKLYSIHPSVKNRIFTNETFSIGIEFIEFLKLHYSQKEIVRLFAYEMQDEKRFANAIHHWRDTLMMLNRANSLEHLQTHFEKVKLTFKALHDEIVRIFNIVSHELDNKESFEYKPHTLKQEYILKELDFRLPKTVVELSTWSKILHNCMFGYSRSIHNQISIIYGVFKEDKLVYAVEISNLKIIQAKAMFNRSIPEEDREIIQIWNKNMMVRSE